MKHKTVEGGFTKEEVLAIGNIARAEVMEQLKDSYLEPKVTQDEKILNVYLNSHEPRAYYQRTKRKRKGEKYTQDEMEHFLVVDPHSPALMRPDRLGDNGVRRTLMSNAKRYAEHGKFFKRNPWAMPADLRPNDPKLPLKSRRKQVAFGAVATAAAALGLTGDYSPRGIVTAALTTAAVGSLPLAAGSRIVNGPGHRGKTPGADRDMLHAMFAPNHEILLNPDGTIGGNPSQGPVGRFLEMLTFKELRQRMHHDFPENPIYVCDTTPTTVEPQLFETLITRAIHSTRIGSVRRGEGFSALKEGGRPDAANLATEMIQRIRSERSPQLHPDLYVISV